MSSGDANIDAQEALQGRVFSGYRIGPAIASGGMATVFMARKSGPGRFAQTVALKIIHPHLARNRELSEMFLDEARLASCVNHPNVCRVLDFGEAEGTFFLAMEYVRGNTWAQVLSAFREHREARLRLAPLTVHMLAQACEGLHAIHEAVGADGRPLRIVHRDVSPQNLLVGYDGSIRVLDFGIASAEGRAHTSSSEVVRGRYPYMAPEQMRGIDVDRRADLWSLGVVLREAISGQSPFARDSQIATMLAVTQEPLPPWPAPVPPMLREIADRALARDPSARFADARQLGNALTHYLELQAQPALGAELAHFMRQLFAAEITKTHVALRQLAGDDSSSEVISSTYLVRATGARDTDSCLTGPRRAKRALQGAQRRFALLRRRAPSLLGAAALFAASLAGSWYVARHASAPSATEPARAEASFSSETKAVADMAAARVDPAGDKAPSAGALLVAPSESGDTRQQTASRDSHERPPQAAPSTPTAERLRARTRTEAGAEPKRQPGRLGAGTLVIGTSQGWAEVYMNGRRLGATPLRAELPSGTRVLDVRPYGAGSRRRVSVEIKPGEVSKLRLEL